MKLQKHGFDSRIRQITVIVPAALVLGAALLFSACVNDIDKISAFSPKENLPVVHAENFETTFSDSGIIRFYLKTPELKRFDTGDQPFYEFPQGILLVQYDRNSQIVSSISSRYAKQFIQEHKWEAKNDVVSVNSRGDTLKTEFLVWDEKAGKIYSDEYVKIIRPDQIITGIGFESDQSLQNWRIRNPKGTIYVQLKRESNPDSLAEIGTGPIMKPVDIGNR